jgi:hypothetical protein
MREAVCFQNFSNRDNFAQDGRQANQDQAADQPGGTHEAQRGVRHHVADGDTQSNHHRAYSGEQKAKPKENERHTRTTSPLQAPATQHLTENPIMVTKEF